MKTRMLVPAVALAYLKADAEDNGGEVLRWRHAPEVRYIAPRDGQSVRADQAEMVRLAKSDTEYVVWLINKDLPPDWQLRAKPTQSTASEPGTILVAHLPREHWPKNMFTRNDPEKLFGTAFPIRDESGEIRRAVVLVDYTRLPEDRSRLEVLLHEMLHALGRGHVDRWEFPETIMHPKANKDEHGGFLKAFDKAALRAVYGRLGVGMTGRSLQRQGTQRSKRPAGLGLTWHVNPQNFRGYRKDKDGNLRAVYGKTSAELEAEAKRRGERLGGLPIGAKGNTLRCDAQGRIKGSR